VFFWLDGGGGEGEEALKGSGGHARETATGRSGQG
jgi:hypothetical protein